MAQNKLRTSIATKTTKKENINQSNFFVTLNSNVTEEYISQERMEEIVSDIFGNTMNYIRYLSPNASLSKVLDIDVDGVIEVGPKYHRVHAHIMVKIKHTTKLQLDLSKIRDRLDQLGLIGNNLQVRHVQDNIISVQDYIDKYR